MLKFKFIIIIFILVVVHNSLAYSEFMWPIDRPKRVTGTYGEYRGTRFHHGLDISCAGMKGFKIYAADSGYVQSVMYEKWGIGYGLFVKHKNGFITLYGHMDRFSKIILKNKKVRKYMKHIIDRKSFRINFTKPEIKVKKGNIIGYSGDSGIGIYHLHFGIKDDKNITYNPLKYGLKVRDRTAPIIRGIYLVPMDGYSHVNGRSSQVFFRAKLISRKRRLYSIRAKRIPVIAGRIGVKVMTHDFVGYRNKVAPYGIKSYINNKRSRSIVFNKINRKYNRRMGLFYDYDKSSYSKFTFFLYSRVSKEGIIKTDKKGTIINFKVSCFDANNNRSYLKTIFKTGTPFKKPKYHYKANLIPGKTLLLKSRDKRFKMKFPVGSALYREMVSLETYAKFRTYLRGLTVKSRVYTLWPTNLCIEKQAVVSIKYTGDDFRKIGVYADTGSRGYYSFAGNSYNTKTKEFRAKIRKLGSFFLIRDDSSPRIWFRKNRRRLRKNRSIKIGISDSGSGVNFSKLYLRVDGRDVIWYFDSDKGYLEILPHNRIWGRGRHTIAMQIQDRAGNKSAMKKYIYYIK